MTAFNQNALLVPQRAVTELQGRDQIAVVGPDNHVSVRTVEMGDRVGEMWIVNSGLKPGERVVSQGTSKIRDGQVVNPQPDTLKAESPYPAAQGENK
jgi:membrane fusion protein (multidrug efflux system)